MSNQSSALTSASASNAFYEGVSTSAKLCRIRNLRSQLLRVALFAAALPLLVPFGMPATAQTLAPSWNQQSPQTSPPQRYIHAMTYDQGRGQVVLFGGFGQGGFLADTWSWNGATWASVTPASPALSPVARGAHALVYDALHGQTVLFGGFNYASTRLGDTWLWNGTNWTDATPASPAPSPSARDAAVMVYDATNKNVVLFGGSGGQYLSDLGDTWLWNGTNWTDVSPASPAPSPSPRADYSMVYDAAHGQVVLFGGQDASGNNLSDTWLWNGSSWTLQTVTTGPAGRYGAAMVYDAALGEVVMWGGETGTYSYINDTWAWNGTNWTQLTSTANPTGRVAPNAMAYDTAQSQSVLFGGLDASQQFGDTWEFGLPGNFSNVNVCPQGQTTPAPCTASLTLTFNIPPGTPPVTPQVVTQGASGLDFALGSGSTCVGTVAAGTCSVNVTFTPLEPGLRTGALNLVSLASAARVVVASVPIFGVGQAPAAAVGPGQSTVINTTASPLAQPSGVAIDASGDLFIADTGNHRVVELAVSGAISTVGSGWNSPQGVAVDGAGDVFVADSKLNQVVEVPVGCTTPTCQLSVGSGLTAQTGVALDGAGDLFIAAPTSHQVVEIPAGCIAAACQITVYSPGPQSNPAGVAIDSAGDLFIADSGLASVVELPADCAMSSCQLSVGQGWARPTAVAVDAAGDLFVADNSLNQVIEVPAGCTASSCQTVVQSNVSALGVALDATGDIFIPEATGNQVAEVIRSQPPVIAFNTTIVGTTSTDSPESIVLQNIGNQPLNAASPGLVVSGPNFVQVAGSGNPADCSTTFSLAPGSACNLSIDFTPQSSGSLSSDGGFIDNALNAVSSTQSFTVNGAAQAALLTFSVTGAGAGTGLVQSNPTGILCNLSAGAVSGVCSENLTSGSVLTLQAVGTAGSTFVGWGGACANAGTYQYCSVSVNTAESAVANFAAPINTGLSVTELGSGSGLVTSNPGPISCSQLNGTVTGTCAGNYAANSLVTLTAAASGSSIFAGWGGVCASSGTSATCNVTLTSAQQVTASFVNQSFGNVNVCPAGQATPAPCSGTQTVTFNMPAATTIGAVQVVTQGVTGLDFSLGSGSTCTGAITAGSSCTVNVTFTPLAPGLRLGAVNLYDNNGNQIETAQVYGVGQGPVVAYSPSVQTAVNTGGFSLNSPRGLAVDANGDIFIADTLNARVIKVGANGSVTTIGTALQYPQGLAVDGAGDLLIADNNRNELVEVPAGCVSSACQKTIGTGLRSQLGVAIDAGGDIFIGDFKDHEVVEVPANGGAQAVVYSPGTLSNPVGLAVDGVGDLFIADFGLAKVVEVPVGCTVSACQVAIGQGWVQPEAVSVDAAGDVFVADESLDQVVEVPAGCTTSGCQIVLASGIQAFAVTVDWAGDVYFNPNTTQIVELVRSQPTPLSFALTNVGSTSTDSPRPVTVQNVGNQQLSASVSLSFGANFILNTGSSCGSSFSLAPGVLCTKSFSFAPQDTGYFTGSASFSDNTFNLSPLVSLQTVNVSGNGGLNGQAVGTTIPNVVGQTESAASAMLASAGLTLGAVTTAYSSSEPAGSVAGQSPTAGSQVNLGAAVALLIAAGEAPLPTPNPLTFENNYFVTGDYASAGVNLRGTGINGVATGRISIPDSTTAPGVSQGVPDGADIVDGFLYWETLENTATASAGTGTFLGYPITGQQIGSDIPYTDGTLSGTLRVYRADVNTYFPAVANGTRYASGAFTVTFPDSGGKGFPITEGASLVVIYRVLSPNFPLKSVVIYDGSTTPVSSTTQTVQGFYDALGGSNGAESTVLSYNAGLWSNSSVATTLAAHASQYSASLNAGTAYSAVIFSTPVTNSDNDGILDVWKSGPGAGSFFAGQPGYTDVLSQSWVALPGARHGEKDLFVQLDYMCGAVLSSGACDPNQENLFPSPDPSGNDPLAMVQQAFTSAGIVLLLTVGNAVPEGTCTDNLASNPVQLCQFPNQPGVIGWKNSLEFSKVWPRNLAACAAGTDCTARFPFGQKDSYHYVLFGHSLAIPAWNTRYGTITSINVVKGVTTIATTDRGTGINACPSRITLSGVLGNPSLNGVYNTSSCPNTQTIIVATPGVSNWSYPNTTLPEPVIGLTSGTITSISGYSDLGGADSAVTLGLWETNPNQNMSRRATVVAGTLFHEIGHTLGLGHGGLYYDTPGSYVPTFEANCKPNYQSVMNYLFQLDGVGPNAAVAYSNQTLTELFESSLQSVTQLADTDLGYIGVAPTFSTSTWYTPTAPSSTTSPATQHCDGTPLSGDTGYRVNGTVAPLSPQWQSGQNIAFDGVSYTQMRGYNDVASTDLRQVGATGGEFASLANVLSFGSSTSPLAISAGGNVTLGSGGTVTLGSGGTVTLGSGGNVTLGSGGTVTLGSGGTVTLGSAGNVTLGSGGTVTPGNGGTVTLGSGGNVTLGSGGTITLGSGGTVTLGSGGNVTLGSGGTIALGSGGSVTIPATGGSFTLGSSGGTITLGSGGNVTLGSGGNVTLGSGGTIALGSGGNVTLGSGGNVTLGSGGTITLGSGGNITLGSGGNVTLGSGGTIALGSGGVVVLGSGGNVTLGSGGTVTLGSGGVSSTGSGGNVTLGSGGAATLGAGGTVTLGSGGNVTLGSGGNVTLGSGGTITLGSGGNITLGSGGTITLGSGGTVTPTGGTAVVVGSGGSYTFGSSGGTVTLGSGGNVTLGSGGNVTLGSGGNITLGSGGTVTLGSGGTVTLGSGGVVTLGSGGNVTLGSGGTIALGSGGTVTLGSGGAVTNELTYDTANSVVRPPALPTETSLSTGVRVDWTAPAFGVVATYTIYRSSNGATPILIGSVSGVNGAAPATEFIDTNPDLTSQTVVYTISTTLVPDSNGGQRQSPPSVPAVLKNDQSITLGPLPSSVVIPSSPAITATAMSGGTPNGLQVNFSASGSCSIASQSIVSNVSTASVALNTTGSCMIIASQPGTTTFNAANSVSGTFQVLPQGSATQSQTIHFAPLQNAQYGGSFSLSASSSSNLPVSFKSSGPCTTSGVITGAGTCTITASAAASGSYSAASLQQSFTIYPAVLQVIATNQSTVYGRPLPSLTSSLSGFVNGDQASVVSGAPALSTTAIAGSSVGAYPITVSTGTLAAANYSFLYVKGTLTIQLANQTPLTLIATSPLTYNQSETLSFSGGSAAGLVTYRTTGSCTLSGAKLTANSGTGSCLVTATMAGNTNYNPVTSTPAATITLATINQTIVFTTSPPASAAYDSTFTVAATGGASGNAISFTSAGACTNSGGTYKMTNSTGSCSVIVNQAGNSNYGAAELTKTVTATGPSVTISPSSLNFGTVYLGSTSLKTVTVTNNGTAPVTVSDPLLSILQGGNSKEFLAVNLCLKPLPVGQSCTMTVAFIAGPYYTPQTATLNIVDNAPGSPLAVPISASVINPQISFSATSLNFGTIKHATSSTLSVTVTNTGATPLIFSGAGIGVTGTNASSYSQTNSCGTSLAAGAKCSVTVKFAPSTTGTFSANLTLVDNAQTGSGTQNISLSGKGN